MFSDLKNKLSSIFLSEKIVNVDGQNLKPDSKFDRAVKILRDGYGLERSMLSGTSIDIEGEPIPWFTYPAIEYLKQLDLSRKRIFEYGSGNSTIYWSRVSKSIVAVEDNRSWFKIVNNNRIKNLILLLKEDKKSYCESLLAEKGKFDIIVIDGKYRDICSSIALKKLKSTGFIILDDSERVNKYPDYQLAVNTLKKANLIQIDFCGFNPINDYTKSTSFFLKRKYNFRAKKQYYQPVNVIGQM